MNVVKILISTAGGGGDAHRRLDPVLQASGIDPTGAIIGRYMHTCVSFVLSLPCGASPC